MLAGGIVVIEKQRDAALARVVALEAEHARLTEAFGALWREVARIHGLEGYSEGAHACFCEFCEELRAHLTAHDPNREADLIRDAVTRAAERTPIAPAPASTRDS